jgi:hypothetical protein
MSRLDELPADQKATLQLLLRQGKSYDELASLLRLEPAGVRERALDALDALGPDTPPGLTPERQDEISDYLLGQQSASERAVTRQFLEGSAAGRGWARSVASELRPLAGDNLPDVPAEGVEVEEAFDALDARREARVRDDRSSRLGGILLLVGVGIALAAALVFLIGRGGDDGDKGSTQADTAAQTTAAQTTGDGTTTTTPGQPEPEQQINMTAPNGGDTVAIGYVIKGGGRRVLGIIGQGFASNEKNDFYYAVWLKGSQGNVRLGFVNQKVASSGADKGKLATGADPAALTRKQDAELKKLLRRALDHIYDYQTLMITRETARNPTTPGPTVVSGEIKRPA